MPRSRCRDDRRRGFNDLIVSRGICLIGIMQLPFARRTHLAIQLSLLLFIE